MVKQSEDRVEGGDENKGGGEKWAEMRGRGGEGGGELSKFDLKKKA